MLKRKKRFVVQLCELIALKLIFLVDMALLKRLLAMTNKFNDNVVAYNLASVCLGGLNSDDKIFDR